MRGTAARDRRCPTGACVPPIHARAGLAICAPMPVRPLPRNSRRFDTRLTGSITAASREQFADTRRATATPLGRFRARCPTKAPVFGAAQDGSRGLSRPRTTPLEPANHPRPTPMKTNRIHSPRLRCRPTRALGCPVLARTAVAEPVFHSPFLSQAVQPVAPVAASALGGGMDGEAGRHRWPGHADSSWLSPPAPTG